MAGDCPIGGRRYIIVDRLGARKIEQILPSLLNSWCNGRRGGGLVAAVLSTWICCGIGNPAVAANAAAYGEQFVLVGREWPDGGPGIVSPAGSGTKEGRQLEYQRQLADRELAGGPYVDGLAEPLVALARIYRGDGDFSRAVQFYRRALHVVRINDGLYSERQVPILRELLGTYRETGDLQTLDQRYDYFFRLYGRGEPPYTGVRLRATLEYLRWQREAIRLELEKHPEKRLLALYELNESLLKAVAQAPDVDPAWYRRLGLSQMRNLYLIQDRIRPTPETISVAPATPLLASAWTEEDVNVHRLEAIQRGALGRGERLLQDLLDREEGGAIEQRARLRLELGDWYQWNGSDDRAAEQYAELARLLQASGREGDLQKWLGQPVELPDNGAFWQPGAHAETRRGVIVSASFDVSARGRASNIETRATGDEYAKAASGLRRQLARTRFRPRYATGEPEGVVGVVRDYELLD